MIENLLKVIHILEGPQQTEHLRKLNVYGLQSPKVGARTGSWSGDSKSYCFRDFGAGSWHETWQNLSHGFCYQSRRNIVLPLLMMLGELCEVSRCPPWRGLRQHNCILYLVSSSINVSFSYYMVGYFLDRYSQISWSPWNYMEMIAYVCLCVCFFSGFHKILTGIWILPTKCWESLIATIAASESGCHHWTLLLYFLEGFSYCYFYL